MKLNRLHVIILLFILSSELYGQTLEEREKQIVFRNSIYTKHQFDHKYISGKPSKAGQKVSITTYSRKGDILEKKYLNSKGEVTSWEKYEYDNDGNRILYERESSNSKYKKASKYNENKQTILEAGFSGEENFRTIYSYTNSGKPLEIVRFINNNIEEKLVYKHLGNNAMVNIYTKGTSLTSKLKLVYNSKGNIIEETVLSVDDRELEKKIFKYNNLSQLILEEKTRSGNFYYRITNNFDSKGNLTQVYEETLAKKKYLKKEYIFDPSGNLVTYKWRRNPDDEFNVKNYTYDSRGICLTEQTYYPNTRYKLMSKFQYTFY